MDVTIRKFEERDIDNKIRWINDDRNNEYLHYDLPLEYDKTLTWFNKIRDRTDRYDAVIEVSGEPVGIIGLLNIDSNNGKAEYYITLGESEYKGKGVAAKASRLLLDYAFGELNLNKVYLFTEVDNIAAQRLFERLGFIKEGLFHNDLKMGSKYVHRYAYGICKDGFRGEIETSPRTIPVFKSSIDSNRTVAEMSLLHKSNVEVQGNALFYKREDLYPFSFGGNKARKAILFFKDIAKQGSDCVVTYGSSSSNHCRVVANMAASRGLPCYVVSPAEASDPTNNSRLVQLLGARVIISPVSEVSSTIEKTLGALREHGLNPYFIQGGGHGNIGTQAYVECYEEIVRQENSMNIHFDYIFLASGTGTTQAGLVCGKTIRGDDRAIVGISVARRNPRGGQVVADSVKEYMESSGRDFDDLSSIIFTDDYVLDGYGTHNEQILDVISQVYTHDGIALDTTYTGKAFWGMQEYLKKHGVTGKNILFIHTGGTPLFFDDLGELVDESKQLQG